MRVGVATIPAPMDRPQRLVFHRVTSVDVVISFVSGNTLRLSIFAM